MANDYISRKKAIEEVCGDCEYYDSNDCEECRFDRLMKIPAADVRPVVKSRWVEIDNYVLCANCGTAEHSPNRNFCHNCGCAMEGK